MGVPRLWMRVATSGLVSMAAGGAVTLALVPQNLPLLPLAAQPPAADQYTHALVKVPIGIAMTTVTRGGGLAADIPVPLVGLATDPRVSDVSRVDATTWRISGSLPERSIETASGLPTTHDVLMYATATDDTYWNVLWAMENHGGTVGGFDARDDADVDGTEANTTATGAGVVVAIVDSGVQPDHPDLPALWRNQDEICGNGVDDDNNGYVDDCSGWDFVNRDNTPYDREANNNHGTHVSGTIAAIPGNGRGVAGLAPGATLMSLKITQQGSIYMSDAAEAIRYAADNGAKVVNASFGTNPGAPREAVAAIESAIQYAGSKGVLVVAAAGNSGVNTDGQAVWPADLPLDNIIAVGASTAAEAPAGFSNFGASSVDLFAPGHYIVSTTDGGEYAAMQGTSMATPQVTAAAALVLSRSPTLSPAEVRQRLMATVDKIDAYAGLCVSGGRLNANQALTDPNQADVTVAAASFNTFTAGELHTGSLTIAARDRLFPTSAPVTWHATLLASVDGATSGLPGHAVVVNETERSLDASSQVLLGPSGGVDPHESTLTGEGVRVTFGAALPAGDYSLVISVVVPAERQFAYGPPVAVFFTVAGEGQPPVTTVDPPQDQQPGSTTPGSTAPGGTSPGAGGGSPPGGSVPGGTAPGGSVPGTAPGGSTPGATSPGGGSQPGGSSPGGTAPGGSTPGGTAPGGSTPGATSPGGGSQPGGSSPGGSQPTPGGSQPATGTAPGTQPPATAPSPGSPPVTHDGITIASVILVGSGGSATQTVLITGENFPEYVVVWIDGIPATVVARGLSSITVIVPAGVRDTTPDVTVGDRTGRVVTMTNAFSYTPRSSAPGAPAPGTVPGGSAPGSGDTPAPGGTPPASGTQPPGSGTQPPTSGTQPPSSPTGPAGPTVPSGPTGTLYRPAPVLGTAVIRSGIAFAPVTANNPIAALVASRWGTQRCVRVVCDGIPFGG